MPRLAMTMLLTIAICATVQRLLATRPGDANPSQGPGFCVLGIPYLLRS